MGHLPDMPWEWSQVIYAILFGAMFVGLSSGLGLMFLCDWVLEKLEARK